MTAVGRFREVLVAVDGRSTGRRHWWVFDLSIGRDPLLFGSLAFGLAFALVRAVATDASISVVAHGSDAVGGALVAAIVAGTVREFIRARHDTPGRAEVGA